MHSVVTLAVGWDGVGAWRGLLCWMRILVARVDGIDAMFASIDCESDPGCEFAGSCCENHTCIYDQS